MKVLAIVDTTVANAIAITNHMMSSVAECTRMFDSYFAIPRCPLVTVAGVASGATDAVSETEQYANVPRYSTPCERRQVVSEITLW